MHIINAKYPPIAPNAPAKKVDIVEPTVELDFETIRLIVKCNYLVLTKIIYKRKSKINKINIYVIRTRVNCIDQERSNTHHTRKGTANEQAPHSTPMFCLTPLIES